MRRPRPQQGLGQLSALAAADIELSGIKVEVADVGRAGAHRPGPQEAGSERQQAGSEGDEQKAAEQGGQASNSAAEALEHAYGEG